VVFSGSFLLLMPAGLALSDDVRSAPGPRSTPPERSEIGSLPEFPQPADRDHILTLKTPFSGVPVGVTAKLAAELSEAQAADYESVADHAPSALTSTQWSGTNALTATTAGQIAQSLNAPFSDERNVDAEFSIEAPAEMTGLDFDIGVTPRLSVTRDGEFVSRRVGGEVRVGQGLSDFASDGKSPKGWYLFAGADGEALVWDNAQAGSGLGDMSMSDQLTVGDMQAGISMQRAGGQLSLSYIRREVKFDDRNRNFEETEDFAGISFTMRR
jgi:hypothetical protein